MFEFSLLLSPFLFILPLLFFFFFFIRTKSSSSPSASALRCYPIIGSSLEILANLNRRVQWTSDLIRASPSATVVIHRCLGTRVVLTGNPSNVQHILKTHFHNYHKGQFFRIILSDFLGGGIFNADGDNWKFQRQVSSHEFNTKSLRKFIETVVDAELSDRLIPILSTAAANNSVLDFQDILQRFAFDNICKIAFGYDPDCLLPSLPQAKFAVAFEDAARISSERFTLILPIVWKLKRLMGVGSEKRLKLAVAEVREFAKNIVREKKEELKHKSSLDSTDLLSRFLSSGHSDEDFITDIVISFILAGRTPPPLL
ncbi:Cytochrome P450 94A1 [Vitis vinifera]|uniref:Cytochrome P450 94A1 n=1 Tax=Vitis vinifera TaxID=29760 RepID=A0A438KHY4_VITVI|nr:Cytochrome P450 94A1 [Vitis vinifera]